MHDELRSLKEFDVSIPKISFYTANVTLQRLNIPKYVTTRKTNLFDKKMHFVALHHI